MGPRTITARVGLLGRVGRGGAERVFSPPGHGKNEADGLGAVCKNHLRWMSCTPEWKDRLLTTEDCYNCCVQTLSRDSREPRDSALAYKKFKTGGRRFYFISRSTMEAARAGRRTVRTCSGSDLFHAVRSCGKPGVVQTRQFYCHCGSCATGAPGETSSLPGTRKQ